MRISEFLGHFYPDENELIQGRVIAPRGSEVYPVSMCLSFCRKELSTSVKLQEDLKKWNRTHGVYFCVNAGGRNDLEISRINSVFAEMDDLPIQEQLDIYETCPLSPSLQVITKKSVHAYWLLSEFITPSEFRTIQKGLVKYFKSDEKIINPSRVMRVPFFNHVSKPNGHYEYKRVTVHSSEGNRYTYAELFNAFPYVEAPRKTFKPLLATPNNTNDELIERIRSMSEYHTEREYGYTKALCHDGKGNNGIFIHLPSGAVKCFKGCSWKTICESFGIYKENR